MHTPERLLSNDVREPLRRVVDGEIEAPRVHEVVVFIAERLRQSATKEASMLLRDSRHRTLLPASVVVALAVFSAPARAETPAECVQEFESSQTLRKQGKLLEAAEALIACSQPSCPEVLAKDCTDWYAEVQASLPSVTVGARDDRGRTLSNARVYRGDALFAERLDGRAIAMNPGLHQFRFEVPERGAVVVEVLLAEGEKNKPVIGEFPSPVEPRAELPAATRVELAEVHHPERPRRPPHAAYIAGGIGVLALGSGVALRLMGASEYDDLEAECAPDCTNDQIDPVRFKYTASTIALGLAGAALLTSGVLFVIHGTSSRREWTGLSITPAPRGSGALGGVTGRF